MLVLQFSPVKPSTQLQVKELTPSVQVPLFIQGLGPQLSMLVLQFSSVKPLTQLQVKELTPSVQVPLFIQGLGSQSSNVKFHK